MKHLDIFDQFLKDVVNLNKTRFETAEHSIETMTRFLKGNDVFGEKFVDTSPQGSFRQGTIIKPADPEIDFDVDILFQMNEVAEWSAKDYLFRLADEFKKTDRYKDKVDTRGKNRCVTIDYESDFHVDIVPCIEKDGGLVIMNKSTDDYESTDGEGYAKWFDGRNSLTTDDYLTKVVRLVKFLRDVKQDFDVKSILLTTMIGSQILDDDVPETHYPDLATSLNSIMGRLNEFLQTNPVMPEICNPVLPDENFNRNWDQALYDKFRERIKWNAEKINEAFVESDEAKSLALWQEVFGEEFRLTSAEERALIQSDAEYPLDDADHQRPTTDIAKAEILTHDVRIEASLHSKIGRIRIQRLKSGGKFKAGPDIKFVATTNVRPPFDVHWQVVNTGGHAASANGLRGQFFKGKSSNQGIVSDKALVNWESTEYTGKHWIECFIVKDGVIVARSRPFFVNITNPAKTWWRRPR